MLSIGSVCREYKMLYLSVARSRGVIAFVFLLDTWLSCAHAYKSSILLASVVVVYAIRILNVHIELI